MHEGHAGVQKHMEGYSSISRAASGPVFASITEVAGEKLRESHERRGALFRSPVRDAFPLWAGQGVATACSVIGTNAGFSHLHTALVGKGRTSLVLLITNVCAG